MSRRITIQAHLPLEELQARYREAKDATERSHYQMIWLLGSGKPTEEVAAITGYSRSWIYELVWGYNHLGSEALGDKRHQNPGAKPLLNDVQQAQLWQALQEPPCDGGLWTGALVAAWMSELLGRLVLPQRGWEYLRAPQMRRRRPRPEHEDTDIAHATAVEKKLAQTLEQVQSQHPQATVELWCEDEHRVGLQECQSYSVGAKRRATRG